MPKPTYEIICDDSLNYLRTVSDNFFDSFVTDAPYGLGKEPDIVKVMQDWIDHGYHEVKNQGGFMGKSWDKFVPQPILWKEVFRTLKPGGYLVCACGTRTQYLMMTSIKFAGFEIRDVISWHYGSGFPKSMDISKAIDKMAGLDREIVGKKPGTYADIKRDTITGQDGLHGGIAKERNRVEVFVTAPASDEAKKWQGWGTGLKPATEFWILARKPISEKTVAENVLKWGTGALNIDGCRVELKENIDAKDIRQINRNERNNSTTDHDWGMNKVESQNKVDLLNKKGRWPSNLILSHDPACECVGIKKVKAITGGKGEKSTGGFGKKGKYGKYANDRVGDNAGGVGDKNGMELVEEWVCVAGCPVKEIDDQSGVLTSGSSNGFIGEGRRQVYGKYRFNIIDPTKIYADSGGASRFFYCAKPSNFERNKGLERLDFKKVVGHNRFDKCQTCGGYILQSEGRPSKCTCENPVRMNNEVLGNYHPTVKPVSLCAWFVRLVTPPGGKVCDPFNGSGTTGIGCKIEGLSYVGVEDQKDMCEISRYRIHAWVNEAELPENSLFFNP